MKKTLISFAVFLLILIGILVFCVKVIFYAPDLKTHVIDLYTAEMRTVQVNGYYYQLQDSKLYKLSDKSKDLVKKFPDDAVVFIKSYDEHLWVCVRDVKTYFYVFDLSGNITDCFDVQYFEKDHVRDFLVDGDNVYVVWGSDILILSKSDNELRIKDYKYDKINENDNEVISKSEDENIICFKIFNKFPESTAYSLYNKDSGEWISTSGVLNRAFHYENNILFYLTYAAGKSPGSSELGFICNSLSDTAKVEISCDETDNSLIPPDPVLYYDQNKMIALAFKNRSGNTPSGSFDSMGGHKHDVLCVFDISKRELQAEYKTRKHERVIYADFEKAITYYDGEYYFRSLDDWGITSEIPAEEIKEGGAYTFDSCGDYIFVFNTETGELLNRISVK